MNVVEEGEYFKRIEFEREGDNGIAQVQERPEDNRWLCLVWRSRLDNGESPIEEYVTARNERLALKQVLDDFYNNRKRVDDNE